MELSLKNKFKTLFLHINYLVSILMVLIAFYIISNYDFFELRTAYYLKHSDSTTRGVITKKWVTSDSGPLRMAYDFTFNVDTLGEFRGTSYSEFDKFNERDSVNIEYVIWAPSYAKIQRFESIEKSSTTLWVSGFISTCALLLFLYSLFDRFLLINELKEGQIIKIDFSFVQSPEWFIEKLDSAEEDWALSYFIKKYTFSYQLKGEKRQAFSFIDFVHEKYKSKDQFGIIRKGKRPRLFILLPKTVRNSIIDGMS